MKEIKTKSAVKNIKALAKAVKVSYRVKSSFNRNKRQIEKMQRTEHCNNVEYAEDKINATVKSIARATGWTIGRPVKNAAFLQIKQAISRKIEPDKVGKGVKRNFTLANEISKHRFEKSRARTRLVQKKMVEVKTAHTVYLPSEKATRSINISNLSDTNRTIKKKKKLIKNAERSAKYGVKTFQGVAKSAQTAQKTAQTARAGVKTAAVTAERTLKAMAAAIKAIVAAFNGLIALIAAGGWMAVTIIIVICLAGFLSTSAFGVLFSNESYDANTPKMKDIVSQFNGEFATEIQRIQNEIPHDELDLTCNGSGTDVGNWRDILAVYAVKVVTDSENGMEVATLDDVKVGILRDIFGDMNKIDYWLEIVGDGESSSTILHIAVTSKSYTDMIAEYDFNVQQEKLLNALMQEEYQQLFIQLIGSQSDIAHCKK